MKTAKEILSWIIQKEEELTEEMNNHRRAVREDIGKFDVYSSYSSMKECGVARNTLNILKSYIIGMDRMPKIKKAKS